MPNWLDIFKRASKETVEEIPKLTGRTIRDVDAIEPVFKQITGQVAEEIPQVVKTTDTSLLDILKRNKGKIGAGIGAAGLTTYLANLPEEPPIPMRSNKDAAEVAPPAPPVVKKEEQTTPEAKVATKAVTKEISKASVPSDKETVSEKVQDVKEDLSKVLQFGDESVASLDKLKEVQDQANTIRTMALMGPAFEKLGAGVSGAISGGTYIPKTDGDAFYKQLGSSADQLLTDYKNQLEMEKQDPNSSYTQGLKDFIKKTYGYDIKGTVSGKDLQDSVMKPLEKQWEQKLLDDRTRELKEMQLAQQAELSRQNAAERSLRREEMGQYRAKMLDDRQVRHYENRIDRFRKSLEKAGGTTGTQVRNRIISADAIFNTAGVSADLTEEQAKKLPDKNLDKLSRLMVTELAIETNRLLTAAGVPAQGTLAKLVPSNIAMDATKLQDYVTSELNPAEQAQFVKEILKLAARVKTTSKETNRKMVQKLVAGAKDLRDVDPDSFDAIMDEYQISPDDLAKMRVIKEDTTTEEPTQESVKPKARTAQSKTEAPAEKPKTVVRKGYNAKTNQTQLIYSDGTKEIVEGRK